MRIRPGREPTHAGVSGIYSVFELSESAVALVLGAVVLISIAPFWFDGRVPVRTYTTARRYYTGLFAYMLAVLILYGGLWFLLNKTIFRPSPVAAATIREATTIATTGLHVDPGADPRAKSVSWIAAQRLLGRAEAADLDSQLLKIASVLVALLLVVMVAPLALLPTAVRRILHRLIGVPAAAERLADQLVRSNPSTPTDVVAEVALLLRRRGYDPDEAWLPVAEPMRALWFKTALLYHEARRWADDPHYRGFVLTASHEFDVLRQSFDQLSLKVVRVLDTVEHLGALLPAATPEKTPATAAAVSPSDSAKTIRNIVTDVLADLREDIAFLLSNVCLFIARCVLAQSLTANGRRRRLAKLGFQLESEPRSALQFFLWAWVAYVLIYVAARPIPMSMAVMIATIQVVALATAIVPNLRFGFACEDLYGRTPWRFVVASGVVAAVLFVPIVFVFQWVIRGTTKQALTALGVSYPWFLTAFTTAATTSFLIQDSRWSQLPSKAARRAADGLVMAVATVGGVLGSRWLLVELVGRHPRSTVWESIALSTVSGLLIGSTVPSQFRREQLVRRPGHHVAARDRMSAAPART
jgi:hypothetical protein